MHGPWVGNEEMKKTALAAARKEDATHRPTVIWVPAPFASSVVSLVHANNMKTIFIL
ncbi:MAG: hypothetical protein WCL48_12725 [Betaproteobacteria bacterium]|jgi:hypothetical protein